MLGSMLRLNEVIADVAAILDGDDYYVDAHQRIHAAILALWERQCPADLVTVAQELERRGDIENIGGYAYLAELWDASPTAANAEYYAKIVRDCSIRRQLILAGTGIVKDAWDGVAAAGQLLESAERQMFRLSECGADGEAKHVSLGVAEARDRLDKIARGEQIAGITTGLADLDAKVIGFKPGQLIVVGARTSIGKTSLGLHFARHAAKLGNPVMLVSLEMQRIEIAERLLAMESGVDSRDLSRGKLGPADLEKLLEASDVVDTLPIHILDTPGMTALKIVANMRRMKRRHGIRMAIIDYIQLVEPEDRSVNRQEQVATISRAFKHAANELGIPVVVLAQLNRQSEARQVGKPKLVDIRESDAISQDSNITLLLWRPNEAAEANSPVYDVELIVAKQRNGPTGDLRVEFVKRNMVFRDKDNIPWPGGPVLNGQGNY